MTQAQLAGWLTKMAGVAKLGLQNDVPYRGTN